MSERFGYAGKVLRVDLTSGQAAVEPLDDELIRSYLGSRGFNARVLFEEVPPDVDALGPDNKLIFGVGPLDGTLFPGSRFNVTAKSPQTGIMGDANAGGFFGPELKYAGYDQLIIEGAADKPCYLLIADDQVEVRDASHLWGLDVWDTTVAVRSELNDSGVQVACIGLGGERQVRFSGIFANLVRACARTGLGAVMGSKKLKAVVVRGSGKVALADKDRFMDIIDQCYKDTYAHPDYPSRVVFGTTRLVTALNEMGMLSTRHFQTGYFPEGKQVSGERLAEEFNVRRKACFGCNIPCSRVFVVPEGPFAGLMSEGPEFEALAGFTSRVGNSDLGLGLKCVDMCNRYGIDAISASEAIAFVMELAQRGILSAGEVDGLDLSWGNGTTIMTLIDNMVRRKGFGDVLADGVREAAKKIGRGSEQYALHCKGLELFQADARGIKGYALGLAVASRGGDHLRAEPFFELSNDRKMGKERFGYEETALRKEWRGKGRLVKYFEEWCAVADSLNVCKNTMICMEVLPFDRAGELLSALTGNEIDGTAVQKIGERVVNLERAYLVEAGIRRADDMLPDRFVRERLPEDSRTTAGQLVELEQMLDDYYEERQWDKVTGIPSADKLAELDLDFVRPRLAAAGIDLEGGGSK